MINNCKKISDDAKNIETQIKKVREGPSEGIGKALKAIGESLMNLFKRILVLANNTEKLAQKMLKHGEDLKEKEKFTPELKLKVDKQGKCLENIGVKFKTMGKNFGTIGDKMESIGNQLGEDGGPKLKDFGRDFKELGVKLTDKGTSVEELGIKLQKLEPNVRDAETDKDLENMKIAFDDISNDLEGIIKVRYKQHIYLRFSLKIYGTFLHTF